MHVLHVDHGKSCNARQARDDSQCSDTPVCAWRNKALEDGAHARCRRAARFHGKPQWALADQQAGPRVVGRSWGAWGVRSRPRVTKVLHNTVATGPGCGHSSRSIAAIVCPDRHKASATQARNARRAHLHAVAVLAELLCSGPRGKSSNMQRPPVFSAASATPSMWWRKLPLPNLPTADGRRAAFRPRPTQAGPLDEAGPHLLHQPSDMPAHVHMQASAGMQVSGRQMQARK